MGVGDSDGIGDPEGLGLDDPVGLGLGLGLGVGVGLGVGDGLAGPETLGDGLVESDGLGDGLGDDVAGSDGLVESDGLGVGVDVAGSDGLAYGPGVADADGLADGPGVADADGLADGSEADGDALGVPGPGDDGVELAVVPLTPTCPPDESLSGRGSPSTTEGRSSAFVATPGAAPPVRGVVPSVARVEPAPPRSGADTAPARDAGSASGTVGAAARVGMGSSSASGIDRIRSTSLAERTSTGSSATTCRTAPTAVRPTAAAPVATAAQAATGIQRGVMSHIVPLWSAKRVLREASRPGCPAEPAGTGAIPWVHVASAGG